MDGGNWLEWTGYRAPSYFKLIDYGYDLYLSNNRGTKYSMGHQKYDPVEDAAEYWDFSYQDLVYDVLANSKAMFQRSGGEIKGWYIGYS